MNGWGSGPPGVGIPNVRVALGFRERPGKGAPFAHGPSRLCGQCPYIKPVDAVARPLDTPLANVALGSCAEVNANILPGTSSAKAQPCGSCREDRTSITVCIVNRVDSIATKPAGRILATKQDRLAGRFVAAVHGRAGNNRHFKFANANVSVTNILGLVNQNTPETGRTFRRLNRCRESHITADSTAATNGAGDAVIWWCHVARHFTTRTDSPAQLDKVRLIIGADRINSVRVSGHFPKGCPSRVIVGALHHKAGCNLTKERAIGVDNAGRFVCPACVNLDPAVNVPRSALPWIAASGQVKGVGRRVRWAIA